MCIWTGEKLYADLELFFSSEEKWLHQPKKIPTGHKMFSTSVKINDLLLDWLTFVFKFPLIYLFGMFLLFRVLKFLSWTFTTARLSVTAYIKVSKRDFLFTIYWEKTTYCRNKN